MVDLWTSYGIVQAIVIVGLVGRMMSAFAFQAHLGVLCTTLAVAARPLLELGLVTFIVTLPLAVANHVLLGWRVEALSSFGTAVEVRIRGQLNGVLHSTNFAECASNFSRHNRAASFEVSTAPPPKLQHPSAHAKYSHSTHAC
jgi:hypothetical protein